MDIMNNSVVIWMALGVLLFWAMGAYNRLMRCRSQGIAAFAVLEDLFNQYLLLIRTNTPATAGASAPDAAGQGNDAWLAAWGALAAAADQFNASLKVARSRPLNGPGMSALRTAFDILFASWARLRDLDLDRAVPALGPILQSQWEHIFVKAEVARTHFNSAVTNYNEAIAQFPALLLAWLFGFRPAQTL
jgi:LemA protein